MQKGKDIASQQLESIRDKILNSYLQPIEDSFQEQRSQLKLINYGTGSGKTHQLFEAICQTIQKYQEIQTIGIYVAPLREHLSVPTFVRDRYPDIPVYKINSLEMKTTDKYLNLYKKWIPSILKNKDIWQVDYKNISHEELDEVKQNLQQVPSIINQLRLIQGFDFGDKKTQEKQVQKVRNNLISSIEKFLVFLINSNSNENNWSNECLKLVEVFFPLYLLQEKSGILMLTYKKFETNIQYFKHNSKKWIKKSEHLNKYMVQNANNSTKFILALDEQEDGYKIMLKEKIDIISPEEMAINNALSSINREFALLFAKKNEQNRDLLHFLNRNKGAFREFQEHLEKGKILPSQLQKYLKPYQKITTEEGNSIKFIQNLISINKGLEESLCEIVTIFDNDEEETPITLNFEMLSRVLAKFENTKTLLIPQELYSEISDDLMNIFSYNNLYIYNIKALQNLYLSKASGGHVRITDKRVSDKTSVAELIYGILAMRSQVEKTKKVLANVLDAKDSQSHALDIWSRQITKVKKADDENATQSERGKNPYLDRQYVYESNKPIVNIKEISRYQNQENNLIDPTLREVSIGSTVFKSPSQYLDNLRKLAIFPDEFIDSLFYSNLEQPKFTPYLAWEEDNGKNFPIISDSINGDRIYTYQNRLYPEYIKINSQGYDLEGNEIGLLNPSTKLIGELYNNLIPEPEVFDDYIPRYNFFNDILYPSLTENFVERWIKDVIFTGKDWSAIKDIYGFEQLLDFKKYPQLYELFDLYYMRDNILFCIDVKSWSKASGNLLSKNTVIKAEKKLKTIAKDYPEFNTVKGLLLNLHASKEKPPLDSPTLSSGNLIYFESNCPVESTILRNFLFQKNK